MTTLSTAATRLSTAVITRGGVLVLLGIAALASPVVATATAMHIAAVLLLLTGGYEMLLALRVRDATRGWMIPMADGLACVGFAVLTMVLPSLALALTMVLVAVWLVLYAAMTGALALAFWPMQRTRSVLVLWTLLHLLLAALIVAGRGASINAVLYAGAGYAVGFGALHVALGLWLRRVAEPYFAPPVQFGWTAPSR